jgi:hypothetical protein
MTGTDPYRWVETDSRMDAYCVTAVSGVALDDVVRRFAGDASTAVEATFEESFNGAPAQNYVLVGEVPGGVLVAENNGWRGADQEVAARASRGGRLASFYRSVNADMSFVHAVDGSVVVWFDPLLENVPVALAEAASGLPFDGDVVEAASFALLERLTGIRVERAWLLDQRHLRVDVPSPY